MDEARRFIRYVTPGLVFATEVVLLIGLLLPELLWAGLKGIKETGAVIAATFGAVLASGGLGFVFSVAHHQWHWSREASAVDYRPCIQRLRERNVIALRDKRGKEWTRRLLRGEAWILVSMLWQELLSSSKVPRDSDAALTRLNDLFHSMGTARVGAVAAPLIVVWLLREADATFSTDPLPLFRGAVGVVGALLWIVVLGSSMKRVGDFARMTMEQTLTEALIGKKAEDVAHRPLTVLVTFPKRVQLGPLRLFWSRLTRGISATLSS